MYQYFGLSSYSSEKVGKHYRFKFRKKNVVISTLSIIAVLVSNSMITLKCYNFEQSDITSVCLNMQFLLSYVAAPILWITGQAYSGRMIKLFKSLDNVDKTLRWITKNEFSLILHRGQLYWLMYLRVIFFVVEAAIQLSITQDYLNPVCSTSYFITHIILIIYGCMYLFFVNYQRQLFDVINYYIQQLLSDNRKIACIETIVVPKVDICYKLEEIRFVYSKLNNAVTETNKVFQVSLLIKSAWTFILSVFSIYNVIALFSSYPEEYWKSLYPFCRAVVEYCILIVLDFILDIYAHEALMEKVRYYYAFVVYCTDAITSKINATNLQDKQMVSLFEESKIKCVHYSDSYKQVTYSLGFSRSPNLNIIQLSHERDSLRITCKKGIFYKKIKSTLVLFLKQILLSNITSL